VWAINKLGSESVKIVWLHSSHNVIYEPDLIALWPGRLSNPTIGIDVVVSEHGIYVFMERHIEHQPFFPRFWILLQPQMTRIHLGKALTHQINRGQEVLPEFVSKTVFKCAWGDFREAKGV